MDYKTLRPHLAILLAPAIFTLLAMLALTLVPDRQVYVPVFPVLYWAVMIGLGWTSMAWAVFQVRICRARKEIAGSGCGR